MMEAGRLALALQGECCSVTLMVSYCSESCYSCFSSGLYRGRKTPWLACFSALSCRSTVYCLLHPLDILCRHAQAKRQDTCILASPFLGLALISYC